MSTPDGPHLPSRANPETGMLVETEPPRPSTERGWRRFAIDLTPLREAREFRVLFIASSISWFGSMITYVVIPYQVAVITGSPLMVGLLGLVELVPLLVMAFVGGALADYIDRRKLVLLSEVGFTLITGALVANALLDTSQVWVLFLCAGLITTMDGIQRPAIDALTPRLVRPDLIPSATALSTLKMNVASIGGPALAGAMIATMPLATAYAIDLASFALSLVLLSSMRAVPPPPDAERPSLRGVVEGLRYAKSRPELMGTYLVDINAMFFGMPLALFPFIAEDLGGPEVLGLLYAAGSVGGVLATLTSGWIRHVHRHGLMVVIAALVWGVAITLFGLAQQLWLALFFLAVAGAADMVSGLFRGTIWDQTIPDHLRGRLAGIEMLSYSTGPTLGNLEAGVVARLTSVRTSVVSGGLLCIAGTIALAAALPAFLKYDGREGLARKQAEDAARAAAAATGPATPAS